MDEKRASPTEASEATTESKPKKSKSKSAELQAEIEALTARLQEQEEQHMRVLAEYANYKRRTEQEKLQIGEFSRAELLKQLLPLLDNLDRAAAAPEGAEYRTGVELIVRQMHELLSKLGVTEISPLGEPFDAELHYAVLREDAAEGVEADTVTAVLQTGYTLGDRLLRPAMVKVAN